jgi:transposase InsO family protein
MTFISAVKTLFQSWKFFHEKKGNCTMTRKKNVLPSYLLHSQSGQARTRIDGRDYLLGTFGSDESRIRYGELVAKASAGLAIGPIASSFRGNVPRNDSGPSVNALCLVLIERWRQHYNTIRPHSALGYRPPASEAWQPRATRRISSAGFAR